MQFRKFLKFSSCIWLIATISTTTAVEDNTIVANEILTDETPTSPKKYEPTWESLDSRPLPAWYDEAKIGIFIHWGVFSVPSYGSEWFWYYYKTGTPVFQKYADFMKKNYKPGFTYQDFARDFTAEFYDPDRWVDIFKNSGAKYIVLTSKHHEGYTLWPSKYSFSWNAMDVGPHRDLVGELATAVRKVNLTFGLYHSLFEWFNPLFNQDKESGFKQNVFVHGKTIPELREIVELYKPDVIWSDGDGVASDEYWTSKEFLTWLYNESPVKDTVVTNDRWGIGCGCKHGGFYSCDDRYNPGILQAHKWENAMTLDRFSWGYRREAQLSDFLTYEDLMKQVVSTISCGGNILINVGPTKEGIIVPLFEERLRKLGDWLKVNGEAIYKSRPWTFQNETVQTGVWYTKRDGFVYATALDWPQYNILTLHRVEVGQNNQVTLLGHQGQIKWQTAGVGMIINMPDISRVKVPLPWVFKFTNITN